MNIIERRLSIAPMLNYTDRHFRYFMRLLSKKAILYTEMISTDALLYGNRKRLLDFNQVEHPLAIQLGGNNPKDLAKCATIAENEGYDEINLNIGCPSNRVQNGKFGACMMKRPELVAECIDKIKSRITIPVTIKTRIGIDNDDSYSFLDDFISTTNKAGCNTYIIHARKAILKGLSPKENRNIPPLNYERVYQIKKAFPCLRIIINGGIKNLNSVYTHLKNTDGVMIGRSAYKDSYFIAELDNFLFNNDRTIPLREDIVKQYKDYIKQNLAYGVPIRYLTKPLIGFYKGQANASHIRYKLSKPSVDFLKHI